jgi:hypothetical protein
VAGTVRPLTVNVTVGGNTAAWVMGLRWSAGFDLQVGEASVTCALDPGGSYYDEVVITVNGIQRWRGFVVEKNYALYPKQTTLTCRDPLYKAAEYAPSDELTDGLYLEDIIGASSGTDQDIVTAVLGLAGVSSVGGIGGTSTILGTVAPEEFLWRRGETALSYIGRIDAISLGYRTYFNGSFVVRTPVSIDAGSPSHTFTEGVDIRSGSASRTVLQTYNSVRVGGYDVGDYEDPRVWYIESSNAYQSEPKVFVFESKMIERKRDSDPGDGMSTESVANYWINEVNREFVKVTMTTPSDAQLLPGQTHTIQASDRLGTGQNLWAQRVDGEVSGDGTFSHTVSYL